MEEAILTKEFFEQYPPDVRELFWRLFFMANDKGQITSSERKLAQQVGLSYQTFRTLIKKMVVTQLLTQQLTQGIRVLTICEFDSYKVLKNLTNATTNASANASQKKESSPLNDIYISKPPINKEKANAQRNIETKTSLVSNKESTEGEDKKKRFVPPTLDEVRAHFLEKGWDMNEADNFFNYWESVNWFRGKTKMQKWRATAAQWNINKRRYSNNEQRLSTHRQFDQLGQRLAEKSARELEQERNGEGGELPNDLQGFW